MPFILPSPKAAGRSTRVLTGSVFCRQGGDDDRAGDRDHVRSLSVCAAATDRYRHHDLLWHYLAGYHRSSRIKDHVLPAWGQRSLQRDLCRSCHHGSLVHHQCDRRPGTVAAASVAILGNSITDGRGSTTNMQNRWPDVLSESLLRDSSTQHVGVLNLGIGGNCVLAGGLGPTGVSRFDRDILNQQGVRWAIVFEGVNDIGGVRSAASATATADNLIAAYRQMVVKAHARTSGSTVEPFSPLTAIPTTINTANRAETPSISGSVPEATSTGVSISTR